MNKHILKKIRKLIEELKFISDKFNAELLPTETEIIKAKSIKKEIDSCLKLVDDLLNPQAIKRIEQDVTKICTGNGAAEGIRRDLVSFIKNIERILG
jgi:hypothetical protein